MHAGELTRAYHRKVSEWHPDKLDTMARDPSDDVRQVPLVNASPQPDRLLVFGLFLA
jgi:hypothetical protein